VFTLTDRVDPDPFTSTTDEPVIDPVLTKLKSAASTPVTGSEKLIKNQTVPRVVGLLLTLVIDKTSGGESR